MEVYYFRMRKDDNSIGAHLEFVSSLGQDYKLEHVLRAIVIHII